ncbi:CRP/FNR family transcriptional regulator [Tissierella praeacuta]|uniref:Crp/Fnr family transcriptional regulator n=1 Tax=Tissierella praeacuta TaxID=43131 RepID=UPI00104FADEC|nr:Crp/Fnr family transcriptional regulator [Tissierella praeacuta]TCU77408.1 CRP/FNR family transcriptional regulator [Tissierella praeacuta]
MDCNCFNREGKSCIEIVPIFSNLSYEEMMEVAKVTREKIFEKGEKLYVIHSGKVKITRFTDTGKEQVIRVLGTGDFMGELSLFSPLPLTDNGEALSRTIACIIDGKKLKGLMKKYPVIALKIMEELSQRLEKAENLIENISLYGVERRLALTLINMANEKREVNLRMSKKDFSSHLGMSQETLSRKLTSFQNMGIIKLIGHRRIILLDIEALREIG